MLENEWINQLTIFRIELNEATGWKEKMPETMWKAKNRIETSFRDSDCVIWCAWGRPRAGSRWADWLTRRRAHCCGCCDCCCCCWRPGSWAAPSNRLAPSAWSEKPAPRRSGTPAAPDTLRSRRWDAAAAAASGRPWRRCRSSSLWGTKCATVRPIWSESDTSGRKPAEAGTVLASWPPNDAAANVPSPSWWRPLRSPVDSSPICRPTTSVWRGTSASWTCRVWSWSTRTALASGRPSLAALAGSPGPVWATGADCGFCAFRSRSTRVDAPAGDRVSSAPCRVRPAAPAARPPVRRWASRCSTWTVSCR